MTVGAGTKCKIQTIVIIIGLPNEMYNKLNGIPKIQFRHEM